MRCKRCGASTWRPHGQRVRTSTGRKIRRLRCASCKRVQDEDAEDPLHGLRRGARHFTLCWNTVADLLPRAPLQQALTRACELTGLDRATPIRWMKSESRRQGILKVLKSADTPSLSESMRQGILDVPECAGTPSLLEDCLALWIDGLSSRIDRAAALLAQTTPCRSIRAVAEEWSVAERQLKELVIRAHEMAVNGFREPAIVSVEDLEERSRRGAMVRVHKRRARLPLPVYLFRPDRPFRCLSAWSVLAFRGAELEHSSMAEEERDPFLTPTNKILEKSLHAAVEGNTDPLFGDQYSPDQGRQMLWHANREWLEAINLQLRADAYGTNRASGKDVGPGDPFGDDRRWMRFRFCAPTFVRLSEDVLTVEVVRAGRLDGRASCSVPPRGWYRPSPPTAQTVRLDVVGSVNSSLLSHFE